MKTGIEELLIFIAEAFKARPIPKFIVESESPDTDVYQDARHFAGKTWEQLTCAELQKYHAAINGFSPEAFCYFFAGNLFCWDSGGPA